MSIIRHLTALSLVATLSSCGISKNDENYDTADGYDTANPYGIPEDSVEGAPYQAVNPPAEANPTYGSAAYEAPAAPAAPSAPAAVASTHTVVKGDTIWGLSKKYGVSQDAIRSANGMVSGDNNVRLGQSINIPAR